MDPRTTASVPNAPTECLREPEIYGQEMTESATSISSVCPGCGRVDLLSEEALDEEGMPTGLLLVTCAVCGRELGELAPPPPGSEAESVLAEGCLLPGPLEEPRGPSRPR